MEDRGSGVDDVSSGLVTRAPVVGIGELALIAGMPVVPLGSDVTFAGPAGDTHPEAVTRIIKNSRTRDQKVDHFMR